MKKVILFLMMITGLPVFAQNWDINRVPPQMQELVAGCYAIYQRTEDKGRLYRNTEVLKKLGMHDQIVAHPSYKEGSKIPFDTLTRDKKDACKMMIYGVVGEAEILFTGKHPKYTNPNLYYCLGYYKTVFNRGDVEKSYCQEELCHDKNIAGCVDKCVKKMHELRSFKMGITDGKMLDYKQLSVCSHVMAK